MQKICQDLQVLSFNQTEQGLAAKKVIINIFREKWSPQIYEIIFGTCKVLTDYYSVTCSASRKEWQLKNSKKHPETKKYEKRSEGTGTP